jgi:PAS domain S-box-containing protein
MTENAPKQSRGTARIGPGVGARDVPRAPEQEVIRSSRHELVRAILRVGAVLGAFVLAAASYNAISTGLLHHLPFFSCLYAIVLVIAFWRRAPYLVQAATFVGVLSLLALSELIEDGLGGSGRIVLLTAVVMAVLLFGRRYAVTAIAASAAIVGVVGWAHVSGRIDVLGDPATRFSTASQWLTSSLVFTTMTAVVVTASLFLSLRLADSLSRERQAKAELDQANLVVENSPATLFRWRNAEGWPVEFATQNVIQFGYTPEQLLTAEVPYASIIHPEDLEWVAREVREHTESGRDRFQQEYRIVTADGAIRWIDDRTVIERDEQGRATHYQGIVIDITERKRAAEKVRRLNEELEMRVARRTRELEAANRELEAFAYSVSHDLRGPLRSIDGFSHAVIEDHGEALGADGLHSLNRVRSSVQRLGRLIDDLLRLSRVTRKELESEAVHLSDMARTIAEEMRQHDPDREVDLVIASDIVVRGDRHLLGVALENLLANAWKFTAHRARARIEFGVHASAGEAVLYVRDNGVGFDPEYSDKLFKPFERLHSAGEFDGTGIGLATVQRVIARHGGRVWAEGEVDSGATFYFTLPDHVTERGTTQDTRGPAGEPALRR